MKPLIINLDSIDISSQNEMRTLLYKARDFDNCLWIAGEWMQKKLGVIDGFISFYLPGFTEMISRNDMSETYEKWCSIRIPPIFEGQKDSYLKSEEKKFLSSIINDPHNTEHAFKIPFLDRISLRFFATEFIIHDNLVGFVLLKSKKKLSAHIKDLEHYITVFFRRSWEELNLKMLRRNGQLMEFEQKVRCIDNEDKLAGVLLEQAMKLTQAENGAIMEINHLDGKISFKCSSPEWENRNCGKDHMLINPFESTVLGIASDKTSKIINDRFATPDFASDDSVICQHITSQHITSIMFVPIIFQGITMGVIGLEHSQKDHFFYPDCFAVELLTGLAAPYMREYQRIKSDTKIDESFRKVFSAQNYLNEKIEKFVYDTGVDFSCVCLIHSEGGYIENVAVSQFIEELWADSSRHLLHENDIVVDIAKGEKTEVISGWNNRFDQFIYDKFGHERFLRAWIPILVQESKTGTRKPLPLTITDSGIPKEVQEDNYQEIFNLEYDLESEWQCISIGTIEVGFKDKNSHKKAFRKRGLQQIIEISLGLTKEILDTLPRRSIFTTLCEELLRLSGAGYISIYGGTERGKESFAGSFGVRNQASKIEHMSSDCITESVWKLTNILFKSQALINTWEVTDRECCTISDPQKIRENWPELWSAGIKSIAMYPLIRSVLLICFDEEREPTLYENSLFSSGASTVRRMLRHLLRERTNSSRQFILFSLRNLGSWLEQKRDLKKYHDEVCRIAARGFLADVVALYEYDIGNSDFQFRSYYRHPDADDSNHEKLETDNLKSVDPPTSALFHADWIKSEKENAGIGRLVITDFYGGELAKPFIVIYLHFNNALFEVKKIMDWLKNLIGPPIRQHLLTYKNTERRLAEMETLRNLAGVNPADDVSTVFQRAVKGLKYLPGYRGCSFFFKDSRKKPQLIMECYDDKPGMFKKDQLPPRRIPLRKLKWTEELVEIKNDSGELMAKVRVLARKELEQEPLKQFHFREGSKLAVVHTWPYLDDRDESTDLHQIVIAFDDHLPLNKDAAYFFGSLGIHLHMGIKQSKQWIRIELGRRLDKYLAESSNYRDFCDNCIRELSEEILGNTHLVYLQRQRISMEQPVVFDLVTHTEKKIDDQLIEITIENHREIWHLISKGKSYRNNSGKMPRFLNPWIGLVKKQVSGILFHPIIGPINRESMGCIFCICDSANKRNPGYTPFHEGIVDVVADKLAIGISHRRREDELSLAFANLGHAVKSPLHGIIGHAEEGVNALSEEDYESTKNSLEIISELVNEADQQVIISTGTQVVETEVSLGQMLRTLSERFRVLAKKRNVKINCYHSLFTIPRIRINAPKLECILVVLLDNAIKYSDPSREIRIKARMLEKGFQIEVSNRGQGILEKNQERIYELWQRTSIRPKGRYIRSSGLGLPAARRICDELDIKIHHVSEYSGRGAPSDVKNYHTRFFLDFPDNLQITK